MVDFKSSIYSPKYGKLHYCAQLKGTVSALSQMKLKIAVPLKLAHTQDISQGGQF